MCKVIYMGPALAAFELGQGKEALPNALFETETVQAAIDLLAAPEYMECLAGGDEISHQHLRAHSESSVAVFKAFSRR